MHELIAFLFGVLLVISGVYVWWTRRQFRRLREMLLMVLGRAEFVDRTNQESRQHFDAWTGEIQRFQNEIIAALAENNVP